jgi:hypothetical protein
MIETRKDGWVNASKLCLAEGKQLSHYTAIRASAIFRHALAKQLGVTPEDLIEVGEVGRGKVQGTYVHPAIAVHLINWLSPMLAAKLFAGLLTAPSLIHDILTPPPLVYDYNSSKSSRDSF